MRLFDFLFKSAEERWFVRWASPLRGVRRTHLVLPALVVALLLLVALPALAEGDPFKGITDVIFGSARTWAGALLVVGLLGVGIRFMTGDPDSNVQTRNFLWGSIACIAAGLGLGVYDWVASWAAVR